MKTEWKINDMPKLESPFVRKMIDSYYVVTSEIAKEYEWVFNDDSVMAIEKLDGTNVSIIVEDGQVKAIFNRTERIPFFNKGKQHIVLGVMEAYNRGMIEVLGDGQHFGELIGEKVQGNPYKIQGHLWVPFNTYARKHLLYKSWGKYPKTFDSISEWFEKDIFSLWFRQKNGGAVEFPEGIVFTHPDGRMAKLRRDMFSWFKSDSYHRQKAQGKEDL